MLLAVMGRTSSVEIGVRVGVAGATVRQWVLGLHKPSDERKQKLESLYGIPRGAWGAVYVRPFDAVRQR